MLSVEISNLLHSLPSPQRARHSSSFPSTDLVLSVPRDTFCIQVHPMAKAGPAQGHDTLCLWLDNTGSSRGMVHTD